MNPLVPPSTQRRRAAFSYTEVLISVLLVSMVLIGATKLLGNVVRGRTLLAHSARAEQYAQQLMAEIMNGAYKEGGGLGPDPTVLGILFPETRADFDDVDDYQGLVESPLQSRTGVSIPNTSGWRRSTAVSWVSPADPKTVVGSDQGVKRITITVERNGTTLTQLIGLRSDVYPPSTP
jgi:MSHA pilin protein MshD